MSTLLSRQKIRPRIEDIRSVFIHIHIGSIDTCQIPTDLESLEWREWTRCSPRDIEQGIIAGLACNRAFLNSGGTGYFRSVPKVEVLAHIFDPAVHHIKNGRILSVHRTTYVFKPT